MRWGSSRAAKVLGWARARAAAICSAGVENGCTSRPPWSSMGWGGVPGVGGADGAGLADIAPVAVEGRGGQQMNLVQVPPCTPSMVRAQACDTCGRRLAALAGHEVGREATPGLAGVRWG